MLSNNSTIATETDKCYSCEGTGRVYDGRQCDTCAGNGVIKTYATYNDLLMDLAENQEFMNRLLTNNNGCNTKFISTLLNNSDFIEKLIEHPIFVDALLNKLGNQMEPDKDD